MDTFDIMKAFSFSILLFILWILLSGHLSPLLLCLGVASVALTVFLASRMHVIDHESYPIQISAKLPRFYVYIVWEIIQANIQVIKCILMNKGKNISPQLVEIPLPQKNDLSRVIYANAITLTPGTVSVKMSQDKILVHALTKEGADDLLSGNMAKTIPEPDSKDVSKPDTETTVIK